MRFRQTTKPTQRNDGSPLTDRDLWFKTDTGLWYRWNPANQIWMSDQLFYGEVGRVGSQNASATYPMGSPIPNHDVWLEHFIYSGQIDAATTSANYWQFQIKRRESSDVLEFSQDLTATTVNQKFYITTNFQTFRSMASATAYIALVNKVGNAPNLSILYLALYYRLVPR